MKSMTFSEKRDIEKILSSGEVTQDNVVCIISSLAKYNLSINHMEDDDNYAYINNWLKAHYLYYVETELHSTIKQKIDAAHTYKLLESDDLIIYKSELDKILEINDIRAEKVLFVLLCVAKLQKNIFGYQNGKYKLALTNVFKLARVHIPSKDRSSFMHSLLKNGYVNAPFKVSDEHRYITFISDGTEDEEEIRIDECDFNELAYVYLNWKNKEDGYTRCQKCNRLIKQSKTKPKKYCEECAKEIEKEKTKDRVRRFRERCNGNLTQQNE